MRLYNPTTFLKGARLLQRTSDLPHRLRADVDEGSMKLQGEHPPATSRRQVISDTDGWVDFFLYGSLIRIFLLKIQIFS